MQGKNVLKLLKKVFKNEKIGHLEIKGLAGHAYGALNIAFHPCIQG
jgi:hypothetical protein